MDAKRFTAALPPGADRLAGQLVAAGLIARWAEPHRAYHNLDHLDSMLSIIDANARLADDLSAVRLAAWYHDAVYDPTAGAGVNEAASADLARAELDMIGLVPGLVVEVDRLIRLTADHDAEPTDRNGCLLADADLAILAAEPDEYAAYAAAVRCEYAQVPESLYRVGRAEVLTQLLGLPHLYRCVPARAEWTASAHLNLRRELAALHP